MAASESWPIPKVNNTDVVPSDHARQYTDNTSGSRYHGYKDLPSALDRWFAGLKEDNLVYRLVNAETM